MRLRVGIRVVTLGRLAKVGTGSWVATAFLGLDARLTGVLVRFVWLKVVGIGL